jgi:hypothetical protein
LRDSRFASRLAFGAFFVHFVNHADYAHVPATTCIEFLANGAAVGPMRIFVEEVGVGYVDHDDVLAFGAVIPGEVAPCDARAHGVQVARRDDVD